MTIFKCSVTLIFALSIIGCSNDRKHMKIDTAENLRKELKGVEHEKITPIANISELESEVNNGGLNQYFFNSSGQNCFATLRLLQVTGKTHTVAILQAAIKAINPNNLPEKELIEKLRKREVSELDDDKVNAKLDSLDNEFLEYPDGALQ
jgi:uncharacterized protein DUF4375